jgi:hypothetical protein
VTAVHFADNNHTFVTAVCSANTHIFARIFVLQKKSTILLLHFSAERNISDAKEVACPNNKLALTAFITTYHCVTAV